MNMSKTITALHQHTMDKAVLKSEEKLLLWLSSGYHLLPYQEN